MTNEPQSAVVHPLEDFLDDLNRNVSLRCAPQASSDELEQAFTEWALEELADHNESDNADVIGDAPFVAESRGQWPAAKLNAWALSGDGATLDLYISNFQRSGNVGRLGLPDTRRQYRLVLGLLRRALDGFHEKQIDRDSVIYGVSKAIFDSRDSLTTVRLILLTNQVAHAEDIEQERVESLGVRYVLWDLQKFSQLQVGHREVVTIDFKKDFGLAVPCLKQPGDSCEFTTYLAFIPGRILAQIYGEHGQRLLERNVRAFLQIKNKVNSSIQKTIRETPKRFLSYNNGLCCTAAEVHIEKSADGTLGVVWARDFQIVNGGQTTASIYRAWKKECLDIDDIAIQVKLTVVEQQQQVDELVPLIARYANSQNKVSTADLAANGTFHQQLEKLSRTVWAPATDGLAKGTHWYYERARGSYSDDKARQEPSRRREWEQQNPARKKFTKTDLAKYENAWLGLPQFVCRGAEKNFVKFADRIDDASLQIDQAFFQHVVARAILWKTAERLFDALGLEGYRSHTVAYAISWIAERSSRRIDLDRIWKDQRASATICECLKIACREARKFLEDQGGDKGEASKKEELWLRFSNHKFDLPEGWKNELAEREFNSIASSEDVLEHKWETVRLKFLTDSRTFEQIEPSTGKRWIRSRAKQTVQSIATMPWSKLIAVVKKKDSRKDLIEILEALKED